MRKVTSYGSPKTMGNRMKINKWWIIGLALAITIFIFRKKIGSWISPRLAGALGDTTAGSSASGDDKSNEATPKNRNML